MSIAWPSTHHDVPSAPLLPAARSRRALGLLALLAGGLLVAARLTGGPDQPAPAPRADTALRALPVLSGAAQAEFIGIEPRARAEEPVITPMETVGAAPDWSQVRRHRASPAAPATYARPPGPCGFAGLPSAKGETMEGIAVPCSAAQLWRGACVGGR